MALQKSIWLFFKKGQYENFAMCKDLIGYGKITLFAYMDWQQQ